MASSTYLHYIVDRSADSCVGRPGKYKVLKQGSNLDSLMSTDRARIGTLPIGRFEFVAGGLHVFWQHMKDASNGIGK